MSEQEARAQSELHSAPGSQVLGPPWRNRGGREDGKLHQGDPGPVSCGGIASITSSLETRVFIKRIVCLLSLSMT